MIGYLTYKYQAEDTPTAAFLAKRCTFACFVSGVGCCVSASVLSSISCITSTVFWGLGTLALANCLCLGGEQDNGRHDNPYHRTVCLGCCCFSIVHENIPGEEVAGGEAAPIFPKDNPQCG